MSVRVSACVVCVCVCVKLHVRASVRVCEHVLMCLCTVWKCGDLLHGDELEARLKTKPSLCVWCDNQDTLQPRAHGKRKPEAYQALSDWGRMCGIVFAHQY